MIYLATDHTGLELKEAIKKYLLDKGYEIEDCGVLEYNKDDDYPDFVSKAVAAVSKNPQHKAIVIGASGQGEAIVANKYPNVRAAVFYTPSLVQGVADITGRVSEDPFEMIRLTREHNDTNVLSLGARFLSQEDAIKAVEKWLNTPFLSESRHQRRVDKIKQIENSLK